MVKKASNLKNLNELRLSERARKLIERKMEIEGLSLEGIVFEGRKMAYDLYTGGTKKAPKYMMELVVDLEYAGYIRPGSDFETLFHFGELYQDVFQRSFVVSVGDLDNETYESLEVVEGSFDDALAAIWYIIQIAREYRILIDYYGLKGRKYGEEEISERNKVSPEKIKFYLWRSLKKLKYHNEKLPSIDIY